MPRLPRRGDAALDEVLGHRDEVVVASSGAPRAAAARCHVGPELAAAAQVGERPDAALLEPGAARVRAVARATARSRSRRSRRGCVGLLPSSFAPFAHHHEVRDARAVLRGRLVLPHLEPLRVEERRQRLHLLALVAAAPGEVERRGLQEARDGEPVVVARVAVECGDADRRARGHGHVAQAPLRRRRGAPRPRAPSRCRARRAAGSRASPRTPAARPAATARRSRRSRGRRRGTCRGPPR